MTDFAGLHASLVHWLLFKICRRTSMVALEKTVQNITSKAHAAKLTKDKIASKIILKYSLHEDKTSNCGKTAAN